eukprot:549580-Rhodomonas_salina.2
MHRLTQLGSFRRAGLLLSICIWVEDPIGVSEAAVMRTVLEDLVVAGAMRPRHVETVIIDNFNIHPPERAAEQTETEDQPQIVRLGSRPGAIMMSEDSESMVSGGKFGSRAEPELLAQKSGTRTRHRKGETRVHNDAMPA